MEERNIEQERTEEASGVKSSREGSGVKSREASVASSGYTLLTL
jgi:hypothetical protein